MRRREHCGGFCGNGAQHGVTSRELQRWEPPAPGSPGGIQNKGSRGSPSHAAPGPPAARGPAVLTESLSPFKLGHVQAPKAGHLTRPGHSWLAETMLATSPGSPGPLPVTGSGQGGAWPRRAGCEQALLPRTRGGVVGKRFRSKAWLGARQRQHLRRPLKNTQLVP